MKNKIFTIIFMLSLSVCYSQQRVTWDDLSKVKFVDKYFPDYDNTFLHPEFSQSVKDLEGKIITISGYFLHMSPKDNLYMLSKGPLSSCFFCGVGGPETAIELQFNARQKFKTDEIVSVIGKFKLNSEDVDHFNYILTECKVTLIE